MTRLKIQDDEEFQLMADWRAAFEAHLDSKGGYENRAGV